LDSAFVVHESPRQRQDSRPIHRPVARRSSAAIQTLHDAIVAAAPKLPPFVVYGMLGYGPFHYKYESGREGDGAIICLASQKNYISLHLRAGDGEGYLAEKNRERLGKVSVGRSCIRFKKLEDLNLKVAIELVKKAAQLAHRPGGFAM
jgi:hypothetical protein